MEYHRQQQTNKADIRGGANFLKRSYGSRKDFPHAANVAFEVMRMAYNATEPLDTDHTNDEIFKTAASRFCREVFGYSKKLKSRQ